MVSHGVSTQTRVFGSGWGGLGGACVPHSASMEIFMDQAEGEEGRKALQMLVSGSFSLVFAPFLAEID